MWGLQSLQFTGSLTHSSQLEVHSLPIYGPIPSESFLVVLVPDFLELFRYQYYFYLFVVFAFEYLQNWLTSSLLFHSQFCQMQRNPLSKCSWHDLLLGQNFLEPYLKVYLLNRGRVYPTSRWNGVIIHFFNRELSMEEDHTMQYSLVTTLISAFSITPSSSKVCTHLIFLPLFQNSELHMTCL